MRNERVKHLIDRIKSNKKSFLIGTAASAHQVEGGNYNDWTEFEKINGNIANNEQSGNACNHYHLYNQDFNLLKKLGFKAHRLSIEWSRIIPKPNEVNYEEINHYKEVLQSIKNHDQINFTTLHHFTTPVWFIDIGGFEKEENLSHWEFYVETVCKHLGEFIDVFNTINEPNVYASSGYYVGNHSPGKNSLRKYVHVTNNLMRAHFIAVKIIREHCSDKPVGLVKNLIHYKTYRKWNPINWFIKKIADWGFNWAPLKSLRNKKIPFGLSKIKEGDMGDFIGINFYVSLYVGLGLPDLMLPHNPNDTNLTQMGWGVYPESLNHLVRKLTEILDLPIYITENGIATDDDDRRKEYILDHLENISELIDEGIDIRGYFYWSNLDNFEWAEGYFPKFGLIEVDQDTFTRTPKESAYLLGEIAQLLWNGRYESETLPD